MSHFFEALNRPGNAYRNQCKGIAWLLVAITILIVTTFDPVLRKVVNPDFQIDVLHLLQTIVSGIASYLIICVVMWLICKCFGSKTRVFSYIRTWGISFFPNIICSIVVVVTEVYFYLFWNSTFWGMVLSIVFVGVLIWKIILYVLFLREVAGLKRGKLAGALVIITILIAILAAINGYVGLKTPIL
jgi:hypothetical protein